jgi:DNA invertase Pin-like site-specific DNA recombinase
MFKRKGNKVSLDNTTQLINNSALIYSRISTPQQKTGTSLESQLALCKDYCKLVKLNLIKNVEEICSARQMSKQIKLNQIITDYTNINIIVLEPSRLCRNIKDFTNFLEICEKKNIILHFVQSITVSNNSMDIKKMISYVYDAETESKILSQRIKRSIVYRKQMKTYLPSISSFGFMIKDRKLCVNENEQEVIKLINKLYFGSDTMSINNLLYKITGNQDEICNLYDTDIVHDIKYGNMKFIDIVYFLNNIGITNRGRRWYLTSVSKITKMK